MARKAQHTLTLILPPRLIYPLCPNTSQPVMNLWQIWDENKAALKKQGPPRPFKGLGNVELIQEFFSFEGQEKLFQEVG